MPSAFCCSKNALLGEVLLGDELRDPAETSFEGRGGVADIIAVEAEADFETERVASAEADGADASGLPASKIAFQIFSPYWG